MLKNMYGHIFMLKNMYGIFFFVVEGTHCHHYASEFKHSQNVTQKQVRISLY